MRHSESPLNFPHRPIRDDGSRNIPRHCAHWEHSNTESAVFGGFRASTAHLPAHSPATRQQRQLLHLTTICSLSLPTVEGGEENRMARPVEKPSDATDRRRANRAALNLAATMREGSRSKVQVRLIDISTHGCRIECSSTVAVDSWLWLNIAGLESQYCRVVWHCQEFIGIEFENPIAETVLDRLLGQQKLPSQTRVNELRDIATRTLWLARQADDANIHPLAELSKACAVDAVVEGLRLGQSKTAAQKGD
jgi:hypothetical protein